MNRPFDEARYKGLLEGLEVSEIKLSALENEATIGAEYYAPEFLRPFEQLSSSPYKKMTLKELCRRLTDGDHGSADYAVEGIPFVLSEAVNEGWIRHDACRKITPDYAKTLERSRLHTGDVLVTKTGVYFGKSAVVPVELDGANTIAHVGILVPEKEVNPYFLSTFLNSRYGYTQLRRRGVKATRPEIKLVELQGVTVPLLSPEMQEMTKTTVLKALESMSNLQALMTAAEQTLLCFLGLDNWQPPSPLTYTRRASEAFVAERLDADFFTPKYEAMIAQMGSSGICVNLDSLLDLTRRGKQPEYAESGMPVINSKHVLKNEVSLNENNALAVTSEEALKIKNGDVLMNGTGVGTIGRAAAYLHDDPALPDNHVTILRPRPGAIDSIYLSVYLNTIAGQWQVEKYLRGSSGQIELYPSDIAQFKIFLAPDTVQQNIREFVISAFSARHQAFALLDAAKRAVEIAIEKDEACALAYLAPILES